MRKKEEERKEEAAQAGAGGRGPKERGGVLSSLQPPWKCLQYHTNLTLGEQDLEVQTNWEFVALFISGFLLGLLEWFRRAMHGQKDKKVWLVHGWVSEGWVILCSQLRFEQRVAHPGRALVPQTLLSCDQSCTGFLGPGLKLTSLS